MDLGHISFSTVVHRDECTLCFDSPDSAQGIDVCLRCFNAACPLGSTNSHAALHVAKTGHKTAVNIKRTLKPVPKRDLNEPPPKKLAIRQEPTEHEKYDYVLTPISYSADGSSSEPLAYDSEGKLDRLIKEVMSSMSSAQRSEVKAWEEEIKPCQHTRELVQVDKSGAFDLTKCATEGCGLTSNLWLCLACGTIGCGRQQFGGGGGNGHALAHTTSTSHPVAVKLGTIEPDGSADVYCYSCDDAKTDPAIDVHLAHFGILVGEQRKTEKSMTELQVEQNLKFDFAMTGEDGKSLEPLSGPGLTGLSNLGNSCYMASALQTLFALAPFRNRYLESFYTHPHTCSNSSPALCLECQTAKIADGLLSGRYAIPAKHATPQQGEAASDEVVFQEGIRPMMFKSLVGKDHPEFSTMRQQDADEFLRHLLKLLSRQSKSLGAEDVTKVFDYAIETRMQCSSCKGVRYRTEAQELCSLPVPIRPLPKGEDGKQTYHPVELTECFEILASPSEVEYRCPQCDKKVDALQTTRFATFPDYLVAQVRRFTLENWVPVKVDVPVVHDIDGHLDISKHLGTGIQSDEVPLPEGADDAPAAAAEPQFDQNALNQLLAMGFPEIRCKKALLATGGNGAEAAMGWLFEHMEDPDIDAPITAAAASASPGVSAEALAPLMDMGFTEKQSRKALRVAGGNAERAVDWLFSHPDDNGEDEAPAEAAGAEASKTHGGSADLPARYTLKAFISHKGPSVHSGHYVAHIKTRPEEGGGWVLFNDEKVVKAEGGAQSARELVKGAYVLIFARETL